MATIKTRTIEINYVIEGPSEAPVILFANSLGSTLEMWRGQAKYFGGEYRTLRYDHRGHGGTEVPVGPYHFDELAEDAVALMDALDIAQVDFVGLSMGGMTALGMALDHAPRVRSISACNCVAGFGEDALKTWADRIATVEKNGLEPLLDGTIERWFTAPTIAARPQEMSEIRAMVAATPVAGYLGCCGALQRLDYLDRLSEIEVPTLFVAGTHDLGTPASAMRDMHARVGHSQYVELDAAHVSNIERPAEFNQSVGNFLASL